jgi:HD domain
MSILSSDVAIPDSLLATAATEILREHSTDLLVDHSIRAYLFAAEQGRQQELRFDPELLYVASAFHDLGLIKKFSSQNERFEVDGANAARRFLTAHNVCEEQVQTVWEAIALHTTRGVTRYMRSEVALLNSGVGLDALGTGFDQFPSDLRDAIVATERRADVELVDDGGQSRRGATS